MSLIMCICGLVIDALCIVKYVKYTFCSSSSLQPGSSANICRPVWRYCNEETKTRMVQLPATAAIEYVAACWVSGAGGIFVRGCFCPGGSFARGDFWLGALLSGGSFAQGDFCPGGLCPFPPSSMRICTV